MEKMFILIGIFVFLSQQLTKQPTYSALSFVVMGKIDVLTSLTTEAQGWSPYAISFSKTLSSATRIQASVSIISFDCFTSNEFSFNTTITSVNLSQMIISTKVYGNTYFRQLSLHYVALSHSQAIPYIINSCFLTSELLDQNISVTYSMVDLQSTETNRFQVISFINGVKMYNNNQTIKYIHVESNMKNAESLIYHTITTLGKTLIEQISIGTIVMDAKYRATFSTLNGVYTYGIAKINYNDPALNWVNVPEIFDSPDMMFFGLSSLRLGTGKENIKLLFHSESLTNFKLNTQVTSFGGEVSYFFMANQQCADLTTPYFNYVDQLCYDLCPIQTFKQDLPVKNCYSCHYSCLTCSGKLQSQCIICQNTDMRTINSTYCSCNAGYVDVGVSMCQKCSNFIDYCLQCDNTNHCKLCDLGLNFDPISKQCICPTNEYFVSQSLECLPYPGCLQTFVDGSLKCQTCNNTAFFIKDPNTSFCICEDFFQLKQGLCVQKCGDGVNLRQNDLINCDDGNRLSGDGCDLNCLIESSYGCSNKINDISICSSLANFTLKFLYIQRIPNQNSAIIVIEAEPFIQSMNETDFNFSINTSIPHQNIEVLTLTQFSLIKIKLDYLETIQGFNHELTIGFDKVKISTSDKTLKFQSNGINLQLTYDSSYQLRKILNILSIVVSIFILLVFIVFCFMEQKMAGTQLLLSCQLVYFTIFSVGNNAAIDGLSGLRYLTGLNDIYNFQIDPNNFQHFYILSTKVFKQYLFNFNVMIGVQVLSFLFMFPFKLVIWNLQKAKQKILNYEIQDNADQNGQMKTISQTRKKIYEAQINLKKYINRVYYPVSLICLLPSIFYFSVQTNSVDLNNKFYLQPALNLLGSSLSLMLSVGFLVFLHQQSSKKRPSFAFFRKGIFYPFYLIFMYLIAVFVYSMTLQYSFAFFVIFSTQIGILLFRVINKPYPRYGTIKFIDSLAKHGITLICMILLYASKYFTQSAEPLLIAIPILLLISLSLTLIRYFKTTFIKKRKNSAQIDLLDKQNHKNQPEDANEKDSEEQSSSSNSSQDIENHKKQKQVQETGESNILQPLEEEHNKFININVDAESDEDEDQLTKIKRRLRKDLRQKRGVIISQSQIKTKNKSKESNISIQN